ncbi:MAG TPA: hypothetical protein VK612_11395 [Pyrinomonadaceae bacterium]|nr:hypothetical protein [Pyrinomonadaceae bacterium]
MPIEGIETTTDEAAQTAAAGQQAAAANTSDATAQNTGAAGAGSGTQAGSQAEGTPEKTFTQEQLDKILANRINSGVKAALKKLTGDPEGTITLEDLQRQLTEERSARHALEARQSVTKYLTDPANKFSLRPENIPAIEDLIHSRIEIDNEGKPTNLPEAVNAVKALAPTLFANTPAHADAGAGRTPATTGTNMNDFIRRAAGYGN